MRPIEEKHEENYPTIELSNDRSYELENENNLLKSQIIEYKTKIEILTQENNALKVQNNIPVENGSQEILLLKEEIERYIQEINVQKMNWQSSRNTKGKRKKKSVS